MPCRNNRRCSRCSSGVQQPGGGAVVCMRLVIRQEFRPSNECPQQLATCRRKIVLSSQKFKAMCEFLRVRLTNQCSPEYGADAIGRSCRGLFSVWCEKLRHLLAIGQEHSLLNRRAS